MREAIDRAVQDLLAGHAVLDAQDILTGSFIEWARLVEASPAALASEYIDHDGTIRGTRRDPPVAIRLDSLSPNDRWSRLAVEWCFRMFAYHDLAKGDRFERLREFHGASVKHAKDAVSQIASMAMNLPLDTALDFFARLAVHWARTCNIDVFDPFDPDPNGPGHHLPEAMDRDDWIVQFLLWTIEERFSISIR